LLADDDHPEADYTSAIEHRQQCRLVRGPVWSLLYIIVAIMVVYGLSAHYGEKTA
jgi:hypothetical protein